MRKSTIKQFTIKKLFGNRDIKIPFKDDVKILVGENGLGKTTVLNILYYTLTNKLHKLLDFDFESIELQFLDGEKVNFKKDKLIATDEVNDLKVPFLLVDAIGRRLSSQETHRFFKLFETGAPKSVIVNRVRHLLDFEPIVRRYPSSYIYNALKTICGYGDNDNLIKEARTILKKELLNTEILYFPTFRRIEEDLINLGLGDEKLGLGKNDSRLIQFGMRDVLDRLNEIKIEINNLSSKGLSQISSEILSQLVKGIPNIDQDTLSQISTRDIEIILARVGEAISKEDKTKIINIVSQRVFNQSDDRYLIYFLQKLVQIYEEQRAIDTAIEGFVNVCNKYLKMSQKEIQYEASEVDFYLANTQDNNRVLLSELLGKLSSGEKQIISLFARIYLSGDSEFIVLFDEPELSLSLYWQKLLLPDIISSNRCQLLLAVTHSPFIFENELEFSAIGLNEYIKTSKK